MMTEKQATGKFGEDFAVDYLISNGYNILDTNWRLILWRRKVILSFFAK